MSQSMAFLFLDECSYEPLDLAALTGVLVPLERYAAVRDEMCKIVADILRPPANTIPAPVELHARELLSVLKERAQSDLDRDRLEVLSKAVGLVNDHDLAVIRFAYLNRKEIARTMSLDPKLYGLNFLNIQRALQGIMRDTIVLPVMDGVPGCAPSTAKPPAIDPQLIGAFARNVRMLHHMRQYEIGKSVSTESMSNLAEPVFADSAHSVLLQLVDLISHLLLQLERLEFEPEAKISDYRQATLECAKSLRSDLVHSWKGRMQFI